MFKLAELNCFQSSGNALFVLLELEGLSDACKDLEFILDASVVGLEVMDIENGLTTVGVLSKSLALHSLVFSVDSNSFPSWNRCIEFFSSSVINQSVRIDLFSFGDSGKVCSILPVIFLKVGASHGIEWVLIVVEQSHDWWLTSKFFVLTTLVYNIGVETNLLSVMDE